MPDETLQLRDLVAPEPMLRHPGLPWWGWALVALAVVLAALLVTAIARRRRATPPPLPVDREIAYREAVEAVAACVGLPKREAALRASGAIRLYLSRVCNDPSLFETHEEFVARHRALERLPETTREQLSMLLSRLASLKYDQPDPAAAPADFTTQPLSVLRQVHQQSAA